MGINGIKPSYKKDLKRGLKKSDPIINYPSLREYGFEHIDDWLLENKEDDFLLKFYFRYINKTILELMHKIDDQNASVIRRGFKLLEKWEKENG